MGLFKKMKDILFDEEEYTEPIKITPEMRNEATPTKEERTEVKDTVKPQEEVPVRKIESREEVKKQTPENNQGVSERELFKSDSTFPFFDFDEEEFDHQKPVSKPVVTKTEETSISVPKRSTNVFEYERKKKIEKRTDYGRYEKTETVETIERKKFKPSPIISPVYGVLNKDYQKEDVVKRETIVETKTDLDIKSVREKAFGDRKEYPETREERNTKEAVKEEKYYEEKTVTLPLPDEKQKKVKTIDELLEETSDVVVDIDRDLDDDVKEIVPSFEKERETEIEKTAEVPTQDDTLENDLFDLIDSMYDNKEDGE